VADDPDTANTVPDHCQFPDPKLHRCLTNFEQAENTRDSFIGRMGRDQLTAANTIHQALMPESSQGSALVLAGQTILDQKRYLTRDDSKELRDLYTSLHNAEALASWMQVEYTATLSPNEHVPADGLFTFQRKAQQYVDANTAEDNSRPPMIPADAVIDGGKTGARSTSDRPMWLPASPDDQSWFPGYGDVPAFTAVDQLINGLNTSSGFNNWHAPTKAQALQLLQNCDRTPCTGSALDPSQTIADYLRGLNKSSDLWQGLFCNQANPNISCDKGLHRFVWASDTDNEMMQCGYTLGYFGIHLIASRKYPEHLGMFLASKSPATAWQRVPKLPGEVPGYTLQLDRVSHDLCDKYMTAQLRLPENKGVALAARTTEKKISAGSVEGQHDLNTTYCVDYMDQPALVSPCVQ
jgi:hypothetical protein